ncbi:hypothetical protein FZEAL_8080, partial [Fusarium zealandicum]
MGVIGISLIVASVVWVLVRPPSWIPSPMQILLRWRGSPPAITAKEPESPSQAEDEAEAVSETGPSAASAPRVLVSLDHELKPDLRLRADPAEQPDNRTTRASSSDPNHSRHSQQPVSQGVAASSPSVPQQPVKNDAASMPPPPLPKIVPQPPTI